VRLFASTAKGTETALRDELMELGFARVRAQRGGVEFEGGRQDAYRACFWSRVAMRVLEPIGEFDCVSEDALYDGVFACDLEAVLTPRQTLLVSAAARNSRLTHTQYIAQKTKDALVDRQRQRFGERSNVERDDPDVHLFVHLVRDRATLYLDHAGTPLYQRGYRKQVGDAPLKENLAAAVLRLAGYRPDLSCVDPLCGSGTLLIEAALWAANIAPGSLRARFGFERWACHDATERRFMTELREAARAGQLREYPTLLGSDLDSSALENAAANALRAGVRLTLEPGHFAKARPREARGALVSNPPYGERIARTPELARDLARLIDRFPDHFAGLLTAEEQPLGRTRRRPRLFALFNGNIACSLRTYAPVSTASDREDGARE